MLGATTRSGRGPRFADPTTFDNLNSGKDALCKRTCLSDIKLNRALVWHGDNLDKDDTLILPCLAQHCFFVARVLGHVCRGA